MGAVAGASLPESQTAILYWICGDGAINIHNAEKEPTGTYSHHHSVNVIVALSTTKGEGSRSALATYIDV